MAYLISVIKILNLRLALLALLNSSVAVEV